MRRKRKCHSCRNWFSPERKRDRYCSGECGRAGKTGGYQPLGGVWGFRCGHSVRLPSVLKQTNKFVAWKSCPLTVRGGCWICRRCISKRQLEVRSGGSKHGLAGRLRHVLTTNRRHAAARGYAPISNSIPEIIEIWKNQNDKCKSCLKPLEFKGRTSHIDHCHATGKVRGILCRKCNWSEGFFNSLNDEQFASVLKYIRRARQTQV